MSKSTKFPSSGTRQVTIMPVNQAPVYVTELCRHEVRKIIKTNTITTHKTATTKITQVRRELKVIDKVRSKSVSTMETKLAVFPVSRHSSTGNYHEVLDKYSLKKSQNHETSRKAYDDETFMNMYPARSVSGISFNFGFELGQAKDMKKNTLKNLPRVPANKEIAKKDVSRKSCPSNSRIKCKSVSSINDTKNSCMSLCEHGVNYMSKKSIITDDEQSLSSSIVSRNMSKNMRSVGVNSSKNISSVSVNSSKYNSNVDGENNYIFKRPNITSKKSVNCSQNASSASAYTSESISNGGGSNKTISKKCSVLDKENVLYPNDVEDCLAKSFGGISPIKPHPLGVSSVFPNDIPQQKRQPKVRRKISEVGVSTGDDCNLEYLEDIMVCIKERETYIVLPESFMNILNKYGKDGRAQIVNWFIKQQVLLKFSESEFFLTINLMDQILARIFVPLNMYQLLLLASFWIINKQIGTTGFNVEAILALSGNVYRESELLKMEVKILKLINFQLHSVDPTICAYYYSSQLNIGSIEIVRLTTHFVLDCFALDSEFSTFRASILAAAALSVTIQMFYSIEIGRLDNFFIKFLSPEELKLKKCVQSDMYAQVLMASEDENRLNEAYNKYSQKKIF